MAVVERELVGGECSYWACIPSEKTLFMLVADWRIADSPDDNMTRLTTGPRTGQLLTARAPVAGAGWP